jgi:hypothetical protein
LGDHLFYSHLPKIAKEVAGFDRVCISSRSEFRSDAYRHLIWELNPYVDGFTDEDAPTPEFGTVPEGMNILDRIMLERGLDDGARFHEPEIHYRPALKPELATTFVYDPNYVSYVGEIDPRKVEQSLAEERENLVQLRPRQPSFPLPLRCREMETQSLLDYCDIIHSCKGFICLASGGATLAAALGRPARVFHGRGQNSMFHHSKRHTYCDVSDPGSRSLARPNARTLWRKAWKGW